MFVSTKINLPRATQCSKHSWQTENRFEKDIDAHTREFGSSGPFGKNTFILNYLRPDAAIIIPEVLIKLLDLNPIGSRVGPWVFGSKWTCEDLYTRVRLSPLILWSALTLHFMIHI